MNSPVEKSLSARVMAWQMVRNPWRVVTTEGNSEFAVARTLALKGFETSVPIELRRSYARGHKRGDVTESPLIPRVVFVRMELSVFRDIKSMHRAITGWEMDGEGFPEMVPDGQMEVFLEAHAKWLEDARKRLADGKSVLGRGKRAKLRSIPFRDALIELQMQFDKTPEEA